MIQNENGRWKVIVNQGDGLFEEEQHASQAKENVLMLSLLVNVNVSERENGENGIPLKISMKNESLDASEYVQAEMET